MCAAHIEQACKIRQSDNLKMRKGLSDLHRRELDFHRQPKQKLQRQDNFGEGSNGSFLNVIHTEKIGQNEARQREQEQRNKQAKKQPSQATYRSNDDKKSLHNMKE